MFGGFLHGGGAGSVPASLDELSMSSMPNPNGAPAESPTGPLGLEDSLFDENDTQGATKGPTAEEQLLAEIDSEESTEDNQTDDTEDVQPEEDEADSESEDEDESDESNQGTKTYRLGNQVFATADDAIGEASRIIGRNAQLAGDLRSKESEISRLQASLEEAVRANQEWQDYYASVEEGNPGIKPTEKPLDVDAIAAKIEERVTSREQARAIAQQQESEINALFALKSFRQVVDDVRNLADKINPFTGKAFTPFEAYDIAIARKGIANERLGATPPKAKEPKKIDRSQVKKAAALPTNGGSSTPGKPQSKGKDFADELLSEQIFL